MRTANRIPIFTLYGETLDWPTPDLIHCESIAERSRVHNWAIKPHRHRGLTQLLYLNQGDGGTAQLDNAFYRLTPPTIVHIPEMCVHEFNFSQDMTGTVLTLAAPLYRQIANRLDTLLPLAREAFVHPLGEHHPRIDTLISHIFSEYQNTAPGRELMLESLLHTLLIWISRQHLHSRSGGELNRNRGSGHLRQFFQLVEESFKNQHPIDHYAAALGISAAHLNALCRRIANKSALEVIHERLLLEAKRHLIYTVMTVSQISDNLGFSEPAYFSRFFKRHARQSPKDFRQQHNV